jgi:hypothetical protein
LIGPEPEIDDGFEADREDIVYPPTVIRSFAVYGIS